MSQRRNTVPYGTDWPGTRGLAPRQSTVGAVPRAITHQHHGCSRTPVSAETTNIALSRPGKILLYCFSER